MKIKLNTKYWKNKIEIIENLGYAINEVNNLNFDWEKYNNKKIIIEINESNNNETFLEVNENEIKILINKKHFLYDDDNDRWSNDYFGTKTTRFGKSSITFCCVHWPKRKKDGEYD